MYAIFCRGPGTRRAPCPRLQHDCFRRNMSKCGELQKWLRAKLLVDSLPNTESGVESETEVMSTSISILFFVSGLHLYSLTTKDEQKRPLRYQDTTCQIKYNCLGGSNCCLLIHTLLGPILANGRFLVQEKPAKGRRYNNVFCGPMWLVPYRTCFSI
jgi:hypothetical protein